MSVKNRICHSIDDEKDIQPAPLDLRSAFHHRSPRDPTGRTQSISVNGVQPAHGVVACSVPQGSVLRSIHLSHQRRG